MVISEDDRRIPGNFVPATMVARLVDRPAYDEGGDSLKAGIFTAAEPELTMVKVNTVDNKGYPQEKKVLKLCEDSCPDKTVSVKVSGNWNPEVIYPAVVVPSPVKTEAKKDDANEDDGLKPVTETVDSLKAGEIKKVNEAKMVAEFLKNKIPENSLKSKDQIPGYQSYFQ